MGDAKNVLISEKNHSQIQVTESSNLSSICLTSSHSRHIKVGKVLVHSTQTIIHLIPLAITTVHCTVHYIL